MNEITYKGETLSFLQLLKNHKVEIPIIQRDYAQGRKDKQEIRDNFLNALHVSLSESKSVKLDFIYGSNIENSFQPLDGQQRLTTLFLLHWYALLKDNHSDLESTNLLKKFSYETRISSREFCSAILDNKIEIKSTDKDLSSKIMDSSWFFLSWKKDPTIDAMLRTIDDIHRRFFEIENLWEKLSSDIGTISFYHVELENIGLTDDLYIKMNARGKLLSSFENFKASFEKYVNDNDWEKGINSIDSFAFRIDTKWTDFLWKKFRKNNSVDESIMRFMSSIIMIRQSVERNENRINNISRLQESPNFLRPEMISEASFKYLKECFELYSRIVTQDIDIDLNFPLWRHKPKKNILSEIIFEDNVFGQLNSASYTQKVLFFAQTEYLLRVENFDLHNYYDWMRVIRNIIARGSIERNGQRPDIIRSPATFDGVINLISELSEGCADIYDYLASKGKLSSSFAKDQIDEEKTKAKLFKLDIQNREVIFATEDNDLLMGRIEFAMYCIDCNNSIEGFEIERLKSIQRVISKYFQKEVEISNDLRRALLSIEVNGNYEFYGYWWSFWNVVSANKRCLIDNFRELEYYIYSGHKEYFKKLLLQLVNTELDVIIKNFDTAVNMPNWQKRLIMEPDLLDKKSKSNYIAIPNDRQSCYLLRSKRPREIEGCVLIE